MDMTQNKCCRHGANLRRRRRRHRKILRFIIFSCSIIAVIVFVAVGSRMITSGDGGTNRYDVEAGNNTYDNAVIENSKISEKYSGNFFAASGCGPTTLSMVVVYLTHNREASPLAVAKYSKEAGYSVDGSGSSWTLISEGCRHYGVKAKTVALDESRMKAELDEGHPIVVNVGPGDFTDTGHFMVITGYDDEGFSINDPNSIEKSGKRWLFKNISSQIRAVWSMYV